MDQIHNHFFRSLDKPPKFAQVVHTRRFSKIPSILAHILLLPSSNPENKNALTNSRTISKYKFLTLLVLNCITQDKAYSQLHPSSHSRGLYSKERSIGHEECLKTALHLEELLRSHALGTNEVFIVIFFFYYHYLSITLNSILFLMVFSM